MWWKARLDLSVIVPPRSDGKRRSLDMAAVAAWFHARPGRFRELGLRRTRGSLRLRTAVTAMLLSTQAASLKKLSVDMAPYGLRGSDLCILAAIEGLEALDLYATGLGLDDRGAALIRIASRLTALEQLDVVHEEGPHADIEPQEIKMPRCLELAELRSMSLKHLSVGIASGTEDVLRLSGVPNLEICHLLADPRFSAEFRVDATTFAGCSQLKELSLHHLDDLSLQMGCFSALPALTSLTLTNSNLQAVPLAIAPLTALCLLDLSLNEQLSIDEAGLSLLRPMKRLHSLDVAKREPAVHAGGMLALLNLVKAFAKDQLILHVNVDPELSQTYTGVPRHWGVA